MNTYGGWGGDVYLHLFLTSALGGSEWSALPPAPSLFEKEPPVHFGMKLDETQSRSGFCKEKEILSFSPETDTDFTVIQHLF
jgi:hypothetical protein